MNFFLDSGSYYGNTLKSINMHNLILSETSYAPGVQIPHHYHKNFYICYVVEGSYQEYFYNKKIDCIVGDIIIHPNAFEHANAFSKKKGRCFNIEITDGGNEKFQLADINYQNLKYSTLHTSVEKIYSEFKFSDVFSSVIIEGLVLETIGNLGRLTKSIGPYWLKKVQRIVLETNGSVSLSDVADQLNISASHLAREFKKTNGITFGEYVRKTRIQQACNQLKNSKADILEIALEYGFADQSHFTRTFKKVMNITPLQFKNMIM